MPGLRLGFALGLMLASCTAPNPDFPDALGCTPGDRQCGVSTDRPIALVCGRDQDDNVVQISESCPLGTLCDAGRCAPPAGAKTCVRQSDCGDGKSCVPLVQNSALKTFCVANQPNGSAPGSACSADRDCQSYHCVQLAQGRTCLTLCGSDNHCPIATPRCQALNVTITGVQGMVGSCSPR